MNPLEDSTLDLIYRRRVRSYYPGYVIILLIMGIAVVLPLVNVDVVTTTRGMIRPLEAPTEVSSTMTGILDSTILRNNMQVLAGDTLAWIRRDLPRAQIESHERVVEINQASIRDILHILKGKAPKETTRYRQSYRNHQSTLSHLQLQEKFLHGEFKTAEKLYHEEVISLYEFEKARSNYQIICAEITDIREHYKNLLEEELYLLRRETSQYLDDIDLIKSSSQDYFILAPMTGTIHNCPGISSGSVIHTGTPLGIISPTGSLVAECYLEPGTIAAIKIGTPVKLRFDDPGFRSQSCLETEIDHIDKDVTLVNGRPAYRIRCSLNNSLIPYSDGTTDPVQKGMTFTANIILFRRSLAALILENANRWANPQKSVRKG